jgi:hypothetical protein
MYGEDIIYDNSKPADYPPGKLRGYISSRKVKSLVSGLGYELVKVSTTSVNRIRRGCSGFIKDPDKGILIYFDTEPIAFQSPGRVLYRSAKDEKDYCGGSNHYCDIKDLAHAVKRLFDTFNPKDPTAMNYWGFRR